MPEVIVDPDVELNHVEFSFNEMAKQDRSHMQKLRDIFSGTSIRLSSEDRRDINRTIRGIHEIRNNGGMLYRYPARRAFGIKQGICVSITNADKLTDIGAKVIILDATADITTEYTQSYIHIPSL